MVINKYGLTARFVEEYDASFILQLRTNERLSKFIHFTENNLEKQIQYIRNYKIREIKGEDYYFIFIYQDEQVGLARIYNVGEESFTFGSWLFKEKLPFWVPIAGAIIAREYAFEELGKVKEVDVDGTHEDNKGVLLFSRRLGMNYDGYKTDVKGKYLTGYMLKDDFENNKQQFIRTFPYK